MGGSVACQLIDTLSQWPVGRLVKCCSAGPTGSADVGLAVATAAIFPASITSAHLRRQPGCSTGVNRTTPRPPALPPAPEPLTARGRSAQMAAGRVSGDWHWEEGWRGGGGEEVAGSVWGSHLASVPSFCPRAPPTFTRQRACHKLEVTLCKVSEEEVGEEEVGEEKEKEEKGREEVEDEVEMEKEEEEGK